MILGEKAHYMTITSQVRIHRGAGGVMPDLRADWNACLAACPPEQQLFCYDWFQSWMQNYGCQPPWTGRNVVVEVRNAEDRPCLFLPLAERRSQGLTYLSMAGFYQPMRSFPAVPENADTATALAVRALMTEVRGWDVLRFGPWDQGAPERASMFRALKAGARNQLPIPYSHTIVMTLANDFALYENSKDVKEAKSFERKFHRAGGRVEHICNPGPEKTPELFRTLEMVESQSWLAKEGGDLRFVGETNRNFWRQATDSALSPGGHLDVWIAWLEDRPVAYRLLITAGATSYGIAIQYDESAKKYGLGWILRLENIRVSVARGGKFLDTGPGDLQFKSKFGGYEGDFRSDLLIFPNSLKGRLLQKSLLGLRTGRTWLAGKTWGQKLARKIPKI